MKEIKQTYYCDDAAAKVKEILISKGYKCTEKPVFNEFHGTELTVKVSNKGQERVVREVFNK